MKSEKKLNSYYLYFVNVIKKNSFNDEEILRELKDKFPDIHGEFITEIGRHYEFKSIIIPIEDGICYAIPLQTPDEILLENNIIESMGERLINSEHKWVLPPFIENYNVVKLMETEHGIKAEKLLGSIYNPFYIARQLLGTYQKIPEFVSHILLINEAVESFFSKHTASSITLLLTIIEGISREYCENNNIHFDNIGSTDAFKAVIRNRKQVWRDKVLFQIYKVKKFLKLPKDYYDETFLRRIDEGMDLLISYENYGIDYLYKSNSEHPLNRHSILHGVNKEYYTPTNFYRLFSCLEVLAFSISLNPFYYSADDFDEYKNLGQKFIKTIHFSENNAEA
ncbi:hypothetical protein QNH20_07870 [Neobacillus sp. WH10]|uniref:hypothetical protein n=1 Tax=Neobacillus sp. WH10 TaxID=3047873 RepID=UPI0024C19D4F|nr:hypothetical protein [Neobacillus sp. WH10]WHY79036.1 hypothetical protein QNH20_07870 [Neobacillus sp. WH10]